MKLPPYIPSPILRALSGAIFDGLAAPPPCDGPMIREGLFDPFEGKSPGHYSQAMGMPEPAGERIIYGNPSFPIQAPDAASPTHRPVDFKDIKAFVANRDMPKTHEPALEKHNVAKHSHLLWLVGNKEILKLLNPHDAFRVDVIKKSDIGKEGSLGDRVANYTVLDIGIFPKEIENTASFKDIKQTVETIHREYDITPYFHKKGLKEKEIDGEIYFVPKDQVILMASDDAKTLHIEQNAAFIFNISDIQDKQYRIDFYLDDGTNPKDWSRQKKDARHIRTAIIQGENATTLQPDGNITPNIDISSVSYDAYSELEKGIYDVKSVQMYQILEMVSYHYKKGTMDIRKSLRAEMSKAEAHNAVFHTNHERINKESKFEDAISDLNEYAKILSVELNKQMTGILSQHLLLELERREKHSCNAETSSRFEQFKMSQITTEKQSTLEMLDGVKSQQYSGEPPVSNQYFEQHPEMLPPQHER